MKDSLKMKQLVLFFFLKKGKNNKKCMKWESTELNERQESTSTTTHLSFSK